MRVYSTDGDLKLFESARACACGCLIDFAAIIVNNGKCPDCDEYLLVIPHAQAKTEAQAAEGAHSTTDEGASR